jgi:hypothetical protein
MVVIVAIEVLYGRACGELEGSCIMLAWANADAGQETNSVLPRALSCARPKAVAARKAKLTHEVFFLQSSMGVSRCKCYLIYSCLGGWLYSVPRYPFSRTMDDKAGKRTGANIIEGYITEPKWENFRKPCESMRKQALHGDILSMRARRAVNVAVPVVP